MDTQLKRRIASHSRWASDDGDHLFVIIALNLGFTNQFGRLWLRRGEPPTRS